MIDHKLNLGADRQDNEQSNTHNCVRGGFFISGLTKPLRILIFGPMLAAVCFGQQIDLSTVLSDIVFSAAPNHAVTPDSRVFCNSDGTVTGMILFIHGTRIDASPSYTCQLYFTNVRPTVSIVSYSEVKLSPLPDAVSSKPFQYANCTNDAVPIDDEVSLRTVEGSQITARTSVTMGSKVTNSSDLTLTVKALKLGMSQSDSVDFSRSDEVSKTNDHQTESKIDQKIHLTVPPWTQHETMLVKKMTSGYVDFDGMVNLNADVAIQLFVRNSVPPEGGVSIGSVLSLNPQSDKSPIHLRGQIWMVRGEAVTRVDKSTLLTSRSEVCKSTN